MNRVASLSLLTALTACFFSSASTLAGSAVAGPSFGISQGTFSILPMEPSFRERHDAAGDTIEGAVCSLGRNCQPLGREGGYSRDEWREIVDICLSQPERALAGGAIALGETVALGYLFGPFAGLAYVGKAVGSAYVGQLVGSAYLAAYIFKKVPTMGSIDNRAQMPTPDEMHETMRRYFPLGYPPTDGDFPVDGRDNSLIVYSLRACAAEFDRLHSQPACNNPMFRHCDHDEL